MEKDKPNIILITVDCLRADHMSCYGYHRKTTPFIDELAKEGMQFINSFANGSFTALSVPSFLMSKLPLLWGEGISIAEILRRNGYYTIAFNPNILLITMKEPDVQNGFKEYEKFLNAETSDKLRVLKEKFVRFFTPKSKIHKIVTTFLTYFPLQMKPKCARANEINRKIFQWLENSLKQPFFMWIHYLDVHSPTLPFDKYIQEIGVQKKYSKFEKAKINRKSFHFPERLNKDDLEKKTDLYDASIRFVDEMVKELVNKLKDMNLYSNTILIIIADHGDEIGEHGKSDHFHGHLYEEIIKVPLIIANYKKAKRDEIVSLIDIAPTIAQIANIKKPVSFEGSSLIDEINNEYILGIGCEYKREYIETNFRKASKIIVCRTYQYKLIYNEATKELEFYDLKKDPHEKDNIYQYVKESEIVQEMMGKIKGYIERMNKERKIKNRKNE